MTQMMIKSPAVAGGGPYVTTAKAIEARTEGEQYQKTSWWTGDNGSKFSICVFLRWGGPQENIAPIIFADGRQDQEFRLNFEWNFWDNTVDNNSNRFRLQMKDSSNNYIYSMTSLGRLAHGIATGDWFALMLSVDYSASGVPPTVELWVHKKGDAAATNIIDVTPSFQQNGTRTLAFDYAGNGGVTFGGNVSNYEQIDYDISEFWMDGADVAIDWSDSAERAKFVDSTGKPVGLGSDGSDLTGSQPKFYFPDGDFTNNRGSEADFTASGTIEDATTSPSD